MKYVTNKITGKRYCLDCKQYDCICLPEGEPYFCSNFATKLDVKEIRSLPGRKADILYFYKQTLPNGRLINLVPVYVSLLLNGNTLVIPVDVMFY